jgi:hypothetical protein
VPLHPPPDPPTPSSPRPVGPARHRRWPLVVGGIVLLGFLFGGCVAVLVAAGQDPTPDTGPVVTVTEGTTAPARTTTPATTTPRSTVAAVTAGLYEVGSEIQPGIYRTSGNTDGCYWARLRNFDGDLDSVITNGLVNGPSRMTIKRTDIGVEFSGPCAWTKVR